MRDEILHANGSIQNIENIPDKIKQIYMYIVGRRLYPNIILHVYVEYVNLYDLHLKQNGVLYANVGSAWTTFVGVITVGKFSVVSVSCTTLMPYAYNMAEAPPASNSQVNRLHLSPIST